MTFEGQTVKVLESTMRVAWEENVECCETIEEKSASI